MPYRITPLVNGEIYHVFNRGVAKLPIFRDRRDYNRFLETIYYYQFQGPKPQFSQLKRFKDFNFEKNKRIVELNCYCLMPNHYHFLLKQLEDNGISEFMNKTSNSYTKYFNTRHTRVGPLLQGQFKAIRIESEEQLIHVSRYIHLNPIVSFLVKDLKEHDWSSYKKYVGLEENKLCNIDLVLSIFKTPQKYEQFVLDQVSYGQSLEMIKHVLIDEK
ncbi:transposase [Candidatus Daviesbacteria bacterium]|nr:transposase [Candidatus Daviesbacteria bacterium]